MSREELERAREHCFMAGVGDSGSRLCEANVAYGLAKIHDVQRQLGHPPDATFVGAPDATITRNKNRWDQGFGYGGAYQWTGEFTVLDVKANACGMLAGALPSFPALEQTRARLHAIARDGLTLDGVALDNDLTESNHFVDVFEVAEASSREPAPRGARWFFIMHSSGHEHRGASARGPGLYYDESAELLAMARVVNTPWGSLRILEGGAAERYQEFYLRVQDFNHRRREAFARALFGDFEVVVNATHQGLTRGYNHANIGCYTYDDPDGDGDEPLFPLTLSPVLPAFLVRGARNVGERAIDALGWRARLERHGLGARIRSSNLLPHGGGYTYPQVGDVRVIEDGPDRRRFEIAPAGGGGAPVIAEPRELPYGYRGMEVKARMEQLGLGRAVVQLDLKYVLSE